MLRRLSLRLSLVAATALVVGCGAGAAAPAATPGTTGTGAQDAPAAPSTAAPAAQAAQATQTPQAGRASPQPTAAPGAGSATASAPSATASVAVAGAQAARPAQAAPRPARELASTTLNVPPALRRGAFAQDRQLQVQPGFSISVYWLVPGARSMAVTPWGELLVTQPGQGTVVGVSDTNGDGVGDTERVVLRGLPCPYGMAFHDNALWVAQSTRVQRFAVGDNNTLGQGQTVASGLPQSGCAPHHYRPLTFDWAGNFYTAFGSSCNVCVESDQRRGTVWQFTPDGQGHEYAKGLRNVVDVAPHPATGQLWVVTNERDELGDDVPMDPVGPISEGANYGWPYCYWNGSGWQADTRVPAGNPGCAGLTPYNGIQAHSAPLGISFYTGSQFPGEFLNSAFVGLHGSWNRSQGTGFKVIRIAAPDGMPGPAEDFVAGWLTGPRGPGDAWGRPVDVVTAPDGSLFISDDQAGAVYRVTYTG